MAPLTYMSYKGLLDHHLSYSTCLNPFTWNSPSLSPSETHILIWVSPGSVHPQRGLSYLFAQDTCSSLRECCCCCCCLVTKSYPILCDPMNCSMPGFPALHCLPEFAQTHVHWSHVFCIGRGVLHWLSHQGSPSKGMICTYMVVSDADAASPVSSTASIHLQVIITQKPASQL